MTNDLGILLWQGINSIANKQLRKMDVILDELANRCAEATGRETLTGEAIRKWRSNGRIPRHEYIEVLARACVKEGDKGREWLTRFLKQARYSEREKLVTDLFGELPSERKEVVKVLHNLPSPTYGTFVGRVAEVEDLQNLLRPYPQSVQHIIIVHGRGGVGKSALALFLAHWYVSQHQSLPTEEQFDAIIWFSGKEMILTPKGPEKRLANQVLRTLSDLCEVISTTLRRENITRAGKDDQEQLARRALASQRTLLIIDNLETIDDEGLMAFLREPPAPTKVLITSRHYEPLGLHRPLMEMGKDEALDLIKNQARHAHVMLDHTEVLSIYDRTTGLPLAVVWVIGNLSYYQHPVATILRRLRDVDGDVLQFLFQDEMQRIRGKDAHRLLMALALFPVDARRDAIGYVAGFEGNSQESNDRREDGLAMLVRLSLINYSQERKRYYLPDIIREYVLRETDETEAYQDFIIKARERYFEFFSAYLAKNPAETWHDFEQLSVEVDNVTEIVKQACATRHPTTLTLVRQYWQYLYVRGMWHLCEEFTTLALQQVSSQQKFDYLWLQTKLGWLMKERGLYKEAGTHLALVAQDADKLQNPNLLADTRIHNYLGQVLLHQNEITTAEVHFLQDLEACKQTGNKWGAVAARYYLGLIPIKLQQWEGLDALYQDLLHQAVTLGYERAAAYCWRRLAEIWLGMELFEQAQEALMETRRYAERWGELRLTADSASLEAQLYFKQGQVYNALTFAHRAREIYDRLGMTGTELHEVEALLAELEDE